MKALPTFIAKLIRTICPDHLVDQIEGDLIELYNYDVKTIGHARARRKLFWTALRFFRPGILMRNRVSLNPPSASMLSNYSKIAVRVMSRSKTITAINISGLAFGLSAALLLFVWIYHEFSFEKFHRNRERLYVAWNRAHENGEIHCWSTTPRVLAPTLQKEYASIEHAVSFAQWGSTQRFRVGEKNVLKTTGAYTEPSFLSMFSFPLLKGDAATALNDPKSIVLTEDFARDLFGNRDPLGETVTVSEDEHNFEFTVTGVLKDLPSNTAFNFEYIIPYSFIDTNWGLDDFWGNNSVLTLVMTKPDVNDQFVNEQVRDVEKKHYKDGQHIEIFLYPFLKNRLYSRFENGVPAGGRIDEMIVVSILAICLVLIGCINFINLSTARAQKRAKEISVRKVTGAVQRSLVVQFLVESMITCGVAALLSLGLAYVLLPYFNIVMQEQLSFFELPVSFWAYFAGAIGLVSLLAGGYPAFYLSSLPSLRVLKIGGTASKTNKVMRSTLVVAQFGIAIVLIVGSIVVYRQSAFLQNMERGYAVNNLVYVPLTGELQKNYSAFREELLSQGVASAVSRTSTPFTEQWSSTGSMTWAGKNPEDRTDIERIVTDEGMVKTAALTLIAGRDINLKEYPSDSTAVVINESALRLMNFKDPIGETIRDNGIDWKIVGVVKDFVFVSPFIQKSPVVLFGNKYSSSLSFVYIRLDEKMPITKVVGAVEAAHRKYNPDYPFELHFADAEYQRSFHFLESTQTVAGAATVLAIFIACIGLLGLSIYMIEVKRKEIGIRKVLGGSVFGITRLLSASSLRPIVLAVIIFSPMSWFAMESWLGLFPYRTSLDLGMFLLATILILLVAVLTVSTQTIKVALNNPVDSLRSD
ncbi:MAG TPA: ABC transporter permease [Chryseosolibacter sp.]